VFLSCVAVPLVIYGFQHYISMVGSIILIPLVMVPAMGGSAVSAALIL
jgi:nucleobase transporter 1/2